MRDEMGIPHHSCAMCKYNQAVPTRVLEYEKTNSPRARTHSSAIDEMTVILARLVRGCTSAF